MTKDEALEYWYSALHSEKGIVVEVLEGSVEILKAKMYAAKRDADDPALEGLALVNSPTTVNQLWIVRKDASNSRE